jgi:hypothetical protein
MECPGFNSLFSQIELDYINVKRCDRFEYQVGHFEERTGQVNIKISAPLIKGEVRAFLRPEPYKQDDCETLKMLVGSGEYFQQRALIIGGSRGLGEVTAKLIALGGGSVKLTYHRGEEDANNIINDVMQHGGDIECFKYNVLDPDYDGFLNLMEAWEPTHLYYFATPSITGGDYGSFSVDKFKEYCDFYIIGFVNTLKVFGNSRKISHIFYPTSVYIDELPLNMGEYIVAKSAGEKYCDYLSAYRKGLKIYKPKLPRVSTDQTVSNFPIKNENTTDIMIRHLSIFNNM